MSASCLSVSCHRFEIIVEPCHEKAGFVVVTSLAQLQRLYSDYRLTSEANSQYK